MRIFQLLIIIVIFFNISYVYAESECVISHKLPIAGLNCWFKSDIKKIVNNSTKQYMTKEAEFYFGKIINNLMKNTEFQPEFRTVLKSLFEGKIIFLFKDVDKIINSIKLDKPLKNIIENSLIEIDQIILHAVQQHSAQNLSRYLNIQIDNIRQKFRQNISYLLDDRTYALTRSSYYETI
ncbi:hypothetical protein QUF50_08875 [Thiotrichales bacterium HSG1]|nr:hypothetical protein [Thiotrichales bacterium HSG1]